MKRKLAKLLWLLLGILIVAAAAFFLWPTLDWYLVVPVQDKEAALGPLKDLKAYVQSRSEQDQAFLHSVPPASPIPGQFQYLVKEAVGHLQKHTRKPASNWVIADLLGEYPNPALLSSAIAKHYRLRLFKLKRRSHLVVGLRRSGIELGVRVDLESLPEEQKPKVLESVREILLARAGSISSEKPSISQIGPEDLMLRIPGARDADLARSIVETRGVLSFRIVDKAGLAAVKAYAASGKQVFDGSGNAIDTTMVPGFPKGSSILGVYDRDEYGLEKLAGYTVLRNEVGLYGTAIKSAAVGRDPVTNKPTVNFSLTREGGEAFYKLTSSNVGQVLAVVLDNHVKASAAIQEPIRDQVRVTGFTDYEARNLALALKSGSLPVRLDVLSQHLLR